MNMLIYLGDSLLDTGNLLKVTSLGADFAVDLGLNVSPGTNTASDGIDQYFFELGLGFPITNLDNPYYNNRLVDFSTSGATTGFFGSSSVALPDGTGLNTLPIGLLSQAAYLVSSFKLNSLFSSSYKGSDVFITGGGNDIFNFLDSNGDGQLNPEILSALLTKSNQDDNFLVDKITGNIVKNITTVIDSISPYVDDISVLGPPKVAETPLLLYVAAALQAQPQKLGDKFTSFVSSITSSVNKKLGQEIIKKYGNDVLFIDGEQFFDNLITQSYKSFPSIAAYQQAFFNDPVHPNDAASAVGASYLTNQVNGWFGQFG